MSLKQEVIALICKTLDVSEEELKETEKLSVSIGVDSTEMVELTVALGKQFGVKFEPNEITKDSTPLEIVSKIETKKQG